MTKDKESNENIVPTLLSFVAPGLGQIVKKDIGKGILMMVLWPISIILCLVLIGFITTPVLYIWSLYDAYNN